MKYLLVFLLFPPLLASSQSKYDYHWTLGYDTSTLDNVGEVILLNFNQNPVHVQTVNTISRFSAFGSTTTMSDAEGNLIFYTSGCYVVNAAHEIMENGDSINPGIVQQHACPFGDSPNLGGAISIPWPDSPNLYLLFVNDYQTTVFPNDPSSTGSSRHLYYNVIDMTEDGGLGAVVLKNQIAVVDTMSSNSIEACRHANGRDWWVLAPKSRTNCYFVTLVTPAGIGSPNLVCEGTPWHKYDASGQACFTPDGSKFVRFSQNAGLHIYDFDNTTGILSNERLIIIEDLSSYPVGASVSPNSRYLYISGLKFLLQYDLEAPDIAASRVLLAVPDNVPDPFVPSVFSLSALGPDGKIYISSVSTHQSLHVIHRPDCPGLYSLPERRGLELTSWNYFSVPNMPHFRSEPYNSPCDSMLVQTYTPVDGDKDVVVFPNPARDHVMLFVNHPLPPHPTWVLYDQLGRVTKKIELEQAVGEKVVDLVGVSPGIFYYTLFSEGKVIQQGKLVVTR